MTALIIRRDRTPAILRKLAKAGANTRVARRLLAGRPLQREEGVRASARRRRPRGRCLTLPGEDGRAHQPVVPSSAAVNRATTSLSLSAAHALVSLST